MVILYSLLAVFLGAFVGRFMAMTVHFLPKILLEGCDKGREPSYVFERFFQKPMCWHCEHPIEWLRNIPIAGYMIAKGKCHFCPNFIELKVILLEWGVGVLFGLGALLFPFDFRLIFVLTVSCLLVCCFITDLEYGILPDQFTSVLVWVGLIGSLYPVFITTQEAVVGAVGGYGFFWLFNIVYRYYRKHDGMYPGDFKLNAGIGACIGFKPLMVVLIISLVLLIIVAVLKILCIKKMNYVSFLYTEMPYGCFVSASSLVAIYFLFVKNILT